MGLGISHDCWRGAYSAFMRWREEVASASSLPPLRLMERFYGSGGLDVEVDDSIKAQLPIPWSCLRISDAMLELLTHSDCDGEIEAEICGPLADDLELLLPDLSDDGNGHIAARGGFKEVTKKFIAGLRKAAAAGEPVEFY